MKKIDPNSSIGILLYEVSRLLRRDFTSRVEELGLTQVQWRTLTYLRRDEGCNNTTLADYLEVRPITLTRVIDKLQEKGWVERRPHPLDRRATQLFLTDAVRPLLETMYEKSQETRASALQGFSEDEQGILLEYLRKMKSNLTQ